LHWKINNGGSNGMTKRQYRGLCGDDFGWHLGDSDQWPDKDNDDEFDKSHEDARVLGKTRAMYCGGLFDRE
jgi:hypothetical protein